MKPLVKPTMILLSAFFISNLVQAGGTEATARYHCKIDSNFSGSRIETGSEFGFEIARASVVAWSSDMNTCEGHAEVVYMGNGHIIAAAPMGGSNCSVRGYELRWDGGLLPKSTFTIEASAGMDKADYTCTLK